MKIHLVVILVLFVVVPTAILSLMASRALRIWEADLKSGLAASAENAVDVVDQHVRARMDEDIDRVRNAMSDCLSRGSRYEFGVRGTAEEAMLRETASSLTREIETVGRIFLFMNPWGFLFEGEGAKDEGGNLSTAGSLPASGAKPEMGKDEEVNSEGGGKGQEGIVNMEGAPTGSGLSPDGGGEVVSGFMSHPSSFPQSGLVDVLRREIASRSSLTGAIRFLYNGEVYCFALLRDGRGIYAGYLADQDGMTGVLREAANRVPGGRFMLSFSGPGVDYSGLVVTDSFSLGPVGGARGNKSAAVFSKRLSAPFEYIEASVFDVDPESARRSRAIRVRLFGWGIGLLAVAIIAGMVIVLVEVAAEIRKAGERNDFIIGMSHDLRTPIASIKMLAESILIGNVPDRGKQSRFLETITKECDQLADMIERVLVFMRQEHKADVYVFAPVDAGVVVRREVDAFKRRVQEGVDVQLSVKDGLPAIRADANAVAKVIFNLLDNALKYSVGKGVDTGNSKLETRAEEIVDVPSAGSAAPREALPSGLPSSPNGFAEARRFHPSSFASPVRIEVGVDLIKRRGREWVEISVRDYGVGVDKSELKKIFRKFYRAGLEAAGNISGIGLGLAICRGIVRAHGGKIEVESATGKGSTFRVFLPTVR